ncbi:MAG: NAD(P)-dependent oxidoreductase [Pseudorhodobacter sp.]|nr:NAD(P)-dependent oxidoreductase [Pseudorhodobacter sp.]
MTAAENVPIPVLVTGSSGRVGRALRAVWRDRPLKNMQFFWQARHCDGLDGFQWDIGQNPPPLLPNSLVMLHLAGKTSGTPEQLAQNVIVTEAVCAAALAAQARHVFIMSTAAVYGPDALSLDEAAKPAPQNPYGASKLAAEQVAVRMLHRRVTILRLANLAGADALLGTVRDEVVLDPIKGQSGGPERSYIGPRVLAQALIDLIQSAVSGTPLPPILNLAQQPPVAMADLLQARGLKWRFGPPRPGAIARVALNTDRLAAIIQVPQTSAAGLIADMDSVPGWPR